MSTITIYDNGGKNTLTFAEGTNLLDFLRTAGYSVAAPCGGNGKCGKCRVRLGDETVCACQTVLTGDCIVRLEHSDAEIAWNRTTEEHGVSGGRAGLGAAIDLGTTTVAVSLFDLANGRRIGALSRWNAQKAYGADVISRIAYCMENEKGLAVLSELIRKQILEILHELCDNNHAVFSDIKELFLAGNTVMQHIFAGISPNSIAAAPFTPQSLFDGDMEDSLDGMALRYAPCVAGYVGGDITAGLLSSGLNERQGKALFIDVGTNGEMALGDEEGFAACAVASGPAFEGAGIACGMPAQTGAIYKAELTQNGIRYEVIGSGEALGICGSGLLDIVACLLELGVIDETGALEEDENGDAVFHITETVYIDQRDIRQLQLAKAAVAAGIRRLMQSENVAYDEVSALYLAGGFGNRLRPESAVKIGMLPGELLGRIRPLGNTSLSGAEAALLDERKRESLKEIQAKCRYIELSADSAFNEVFIEEMLFPQS